MSGPAPPRRSGYGLLLLAAGRREGFAFFGVDEESFLASLAPLVAFTLVSSIIIALSGKWLAGAELFLVTLIAIVAPAVIAHPFCRRWQREAHWALYANILNWSKLLFIIITSFVLALASAVPAAVGVLGLAFLAYGFWFQWYVARGALGLTRWRAVWMVLVTQLGTNILVALPLLADKGDRAVILGQ